MSFTYESAPLSIRLTNGGGVFVGNHPVVTVKDATAAGKPIHFW